MDKCRLTDLAGQLLANSIKVHPSIVKISMRENNLKDLSGLAFSDCIWVNKRLKKIDL
jgi:hypothetical protein